MVYLAPRSLHAGHYLFAHLSKTVEECDYSVKLDSHVVKLVEFAQHDSPDPPSCPEVMA